MLAFDQFLEAAYRVFHLYVFAGEIGELLGDMKGLGQEALDFAGSGDGELVFF